MNTTFLNKKLNFSGFILLLSLLSACGSNDTKEEFEPAELVDFKEEINLEKVWSRSVGDGLGEFYEKLTPALVSDTLYIADIEGEIVAIDKISGKEKWDADLKTHISGGVGVGGGLVLVGTTTGELVGLSTTDGKEVLRIQLSGEILSVPQVSGDIIVVQTQDGHIVGLHRETGEQKWRFDSNMPLLTLRGTSSPIIVDDLIYAAFSNGKVVCLSLDNGAMRWENRIAIAKGTSELERVIDIDGNLLIVDGVLYVVSFQGRVAAIDLSTGKKLWKKPASSYVGLSEGFGNIYLSETGDLVKALNRTGGTSVWVQDKLLNRKLNTPKTIRNYVAVADADGYVHFLSQIDGHFVARKKVDGDGVRADMLVDGQMLYVHGNSGKITALKIN